MSSMDFLDKLLEGVAVEWRALGEVTSPTSNIRWRDAEQRCRRVIGRDCACVQGICLAAHLLIC